MAGLRGELRSGVTAAYHEEVRQAADQASERIGKGVPSLEAIYDFGTARGVADARSREAIGRPADRAMSALDHHRMQPTERTLPGLGPTLAEKRQMDAAQHQADEAQARHFPMRRETDPQPIVGRPERMSDARNAQLFPRGAENDDERGR